MPLPSHAARPFPRWVIPLVVSLVVILAIASVVQKMSSSASASVQSTGAASLVKPAAKQTPALTRVSAANGPAPAPTPAITLPATPAVNTPSTPADLEAEYPDARFIEVTGLRVVTDSHDHPQVQYLVVNHAATPLLGIGLRIAVRSAAAGDGSNPIFRVSARVPSLGPHESKEIRTDLDTRLKSTQIPEWENLRTEIRITSQQ